MSAASGAAWRKRKQAERDPGYLARRKNSQLKVKFRITLDDYNAMLAKQGGLCAVCRQPPTIKRNGITKDLAVDHCHDTNQVRGLLCELCNRAIGMLRNDPGRCLSAAIYLAETR